MLILLFVISYFGKIQVIYERSYSTHICDKLSNFDNGAFFYERAINEDAYINIYKQAATQVCFHFSTSCQPHV